jgi:hypothetical protein
VPPAARNLTDAEYAYMIERGGENYPERAYGLRSSPPPLHWTLCVGCADRAETTIRDAIADVAP